MAAPIVATNDAVLTIAPLPWRCMYGITSLQQRNTDVRFTRCTRSQASIPVVRIESSSEGEIPALWNDTSIDPQVSYAVANIRATSAPSVTSAWIAMPFTSAATPSAVSAFISTTTTRAPSDARRIAVALPIPLPPPVMTAVRPSKRCTAQSSVARKTFLTSVKWCRASGPSSRPRPDFLNPPKGVQ